MEGSKVARALRRAATCMVLASAALAAPPTLDAFFEGAKISSISISPDGRYLAMIVAAEGRNFVAVKDRTSAAFAVPVLAANDTDTFEPYWCRWANDERVVCGFRGLERDKYQGKVFPVTRLVAVNRDGSKQKMLLQNTFAPSGQINDRIIDWTPEEPESVLIEKFHPRMGLRVLELNVYNGEVETARVAVRTHRRLRHRWPWKRAARLGP